MMQDKLHRKILAVSWLVIMLAAARSVNLHSTKPTRISSVQASPVHRCTVIVDGKKLAVQTTASTISEVLRENNIFLDDDDKVFPAVSSGVTSGLNIRVIRIQSRLTTAIEIIPRQTIRKPSGSLKRGASKVAVDGRDGKRECSYRITTADGRCVMKQLVNKRDVTESAPRVILYGQGIAAPSRGFFSHRVMTMTATAYDPYNCGGSGTGRTASGMKGGRGVVAVDPHVIKLGTKLYIEGYGFAIAGDTGGAIKGRKIDLGHNSNRLARQFGRKKVVVHVIDSDI